MRVWGRGEAYLARSSENITGCNNQNPRSNSNACSERLPHKILEEPEPKLDTITQFLEASNLSTESLWMTGFWLLPRRHTDLSRSLSLSPSLSRGTKYQFILICIYIYTHTRLLQCICREIAQHVWNTEKCILILYTPICMYTVLGWIGIERWIITENEAWKRCSKIRATMS